MAASNYYQPFDRCNMNCFNIIKHYNACAFLGGMAVSSDFWYLYCLQKAYIDFCSFKLDAIMDLRL